MLKGYLGPLRPQLVLANEVTFADCPYEGLDEQVVPVEEMNADLVVVSSSYWAYLASQASLRVFICQSAPAPFRILHTTTHPVPAEYMILKHEGLILAEIFPPLPFPPLFALC